MKFLACFELVVFLCLLYVKSQSISTCKTVGHFAMTFDDGPTGYTDEILNILKDNDVVATFFILGKQLKDKDLKLKLMNIYKQGHTIASHTYSHPDMLSKNDQEATKEIKHTEDLIYDVIGKRPLFFRFPYLSTDERVQDIVKSLGYIDVGVSVDSFDWREKTGDPENIYKNIINGVKNSNPTKDSFISLHHDTTLPKLSKLPETIRFIREKKYKFVNMETCLGLKSAYKDDHSLFKDNIKNFLNGNAVSSSGVASRTMSSASSKSTSNSNMMLSSKVDSEKSSAPYPYLNCTFLILFQLAILLVTSL